MSDETLVLGLGISGCAASEALISRGYKICAVDDSPSESINEWANKLSLELLPAPAHDRWENFLQRFSQIIISPGIPDSIHIIQKCREQKIPVISEIEFASWFTTSPILISTI